MGKERNVTNEGICQFPHVAAHVTRQLSFYSPRRKLCRYR